MRDHISAEGTVTHRTITETAKEQITIARDGQREALARGDSYTADLLGEAVDMNLDRLSAHQE
jgi:hypothetical protein